MHTNAHIRRDSIKYLISQAKLGYMDWGVVKGCRVKCVLLSWAYWRHDWEHSTYLRLLETEAKTQDSVLYHIQGQTIH